MVVYLADGTRVVGRLTEVNPGQSCTVNVTGHGRRLIPWIEIRRIAPRGSAEASAPDAPPPSSNPSVGPPQPGKTEGQREPTMVEPAEVPPPPPKRTPNAPRVLVHINASEVVILEQTRDGGPWEKVCTSPCDEWLPTDAGYRVIRNGGDLVGAGVRLHPKGSDRVVLDVQFRSPGLKAVSIAGIVVGAVGSLAALTIDEEGPSAGLLHLLGVGVTIAGGFGVALSNSRIRQQAGPLPGVPVPNADAGGNSSSLARASHFASDRQPDSLLASRVAAAPHFLSVGFRF